MRCSVWLTVFCLCWTSRELSGKLLPIEPSRYLISNTPSVPDSPGSIWPLPNLISTFWSQKYLDPARFLFSSNAIQCDIVVKAFERYRKLFFLDSSPKLKPFDATKSHIENLEGLKVIIDHYDPNVGHCGYPQLHDDEGYIIQVLPGNRMGEIFSKTVWGALRGLESFSQMIYFDELAQAFFVNDTIIYDQPAFSHRGMLLDTSRHYIPVHILKSNLDAMSYNKLNVFHWHIVDDQSFPFQSRTFPNLSLLGAYTPKHIYTYDDINCLIEYARLRGIRIIPEFDSPSHTHSIGNAFPHLLTPCYFNGEAHVADRERYSEDEVLNPMLNETYQFVSDILKEFRGLFKDKFVHLGMDEANLFCWESNPDLTKFMTEKRINTTGQLHQYYSEKVIKLTEKIGYKYIIWEDPLEQGVSVSKDTVVEVWKPDWEYRAWRIASLGHRIILSSCWYLNYISYGADWINYYACNPLSFTRLGDNPALAQMVIGGEACMWSEFQDETNILSTLWPRASAVAEKLWYNTSVMTPDRVIHRLDRHRCRMLRRGIPTKPILNGFCGEFEITNYQKQHDTQKEHLVDSTRGLLQSDLAFSYVAITLCLFFIMFLAYRYFTQSRTCLPFSARKRLRSKKKPLDSL